MRVSIPRMFQFSKNWVCHIPLQILMSLNSSGGRRDTQLKACQRLLKAMSPNCLLHVTGHGTSWRNKVSGKTRGHRKPCKTGKINAPSSLRSRSYCDVQTLLKLEWTRKVQHWSTSGNNS